MNQKNCIVLDDEQHSIDILTEYIEKTPNLRLLATFKNPIEAIPFIQNQQIDIAFLDVQMPNLTGLQFLKILNKNTKVILCTAYAEYAIDGFDLNVVDYLLKPVSFDRFIQSIQKIEGLNSAESTLIKAESGDDYIFVKADVKGKYIKIVLKDILFIEGLGNYQKIHSANGQIICQLKMKTLEEQLAPYGFLRVHKSFLIQFEKISRIEGNKIHLTRHIVPIGDGYREVFFLRINEKIIK